MSGKGDKEKSNEKDSENIFQAILFDDLETVERLMDVSSNSYILHAKREDSLQRFVL